MNAVSRIIDALEELGQPSQLPGRWKRVSPVQSPFFQLGSETEQVVERLRQQFSAEDLQTARVLQRTAASSWKLRPSLLGSFLLRLPASTPESPCHLVTASETLPSLRPPFLALLQDARWRKLLQKDNPRLVMAAGGCCDSRAVWNRCCSHAVADPAWRGESQDAAATAAGLRAVRAQPAGRLFAVAVAAWMFVG